MIGSPRPCSRASAASVAFPVGSPPDPSDASTAKPGPEKRVWPGSANGWRSVEAAACGAAAAAVAIPAAATKPRRVNLVC